MATNSRSIHEDAKIQKIVSKKSGVERTFYAIEVPSTELVFIEPETSADLAVLEKLSQTQEFIPELMLYIRGNKNIFSKWCILKHMLLAYNHILESIPKNNEINLKISLIKFLNLCISNSVYNVICDQCGTKL